MVVRQALTVADDPQLGALAVALPAGAKRYRCTDPSLAAVLAAAGFDLTDVDSDVLVSSTPAGVDDSAQAVVVTLAGRDPLHPSRVVRMLMRLVRAARLATDVARARRKLKRLGFQELTTLRWQFGEPIVQVSRGPRAPLAHRLPVSAIVMTGPRRMTLIDAACSDASERGIPLSAERVTVGSSGALLVHGRDHVLSAGVGHAAQLTRRQAEVLARLGATTACFTKRIPHVAATGATGPLYWAALERLPGSAPERLDRTLATECADFLAGLHRAAGGSGVIYELAHAASVIAAAAPSSATRVIDLAARVDRELAGVARGYAHLDFWSGNLLVERGRLSGVVDWSAAGPGHLPYLDLLHLLVSRHRLRSTQQPGGLFLRHLWRGEVWAEPSIAWYSNALALTLPFQLRDSILAAYWLQATARAVEDSKDRSTVTRPAWERENVANVLDVISEPRRRKDDHGRSSSMVANA